MLPASHRNHWAHVSRIAETMAVAQAGQPITDADSFPKQWDFVASTNRFHAVMCSRRAGKTNGSVVRTAKLNSERPGRRVLYINLTALNAEQQFFKPLLELLDKKTIPHRADNGDLLVYFQNGSFVRAMGCDNVGEVKTKLGDRWDEIFVDEMQSYGEEVLYELIDRAALPTLVDRGGALTCQGTPPITKAGYWFDLVTKSTFNKLGWTLFDNPYIKHEIEDILAARGLKLTDPIVRREYFGEICVDPDAVVFKYDSPRNDLPAPGRPDPASPHWRYAMGMDLGFSDHDAIVVLGWRMDDPEHRLYECWTWQENHLDYLKLAEVFKRAVEKWSPQQICVDTGGHGARKIMESLKSVFSQFTFKMKPASLLDSIALVNDEFRSGRLLVDPNGLIAHDARLCVWKQGKHEQEMSDTFHSDVMAALRYAHSVAYHHQAEAPALEESDEDRRVRQWLDRRNAQNDPYNPYRGGMSTYD